MQVLFAQEHIGFPVGSGVWEYGKLQVHTHACTVRYNPNCVVVTYSKAARLRNDRSVTMECGLVITCQLPFHSSIRQKWSGCERSKVHLLNIATTINALIGRTLVSRNEGSN